MPIYDSLTDTSMRYIIEHSESECIIAAAENLYIVAKALCSLTEVVKAVIWWGKCSSKDLKVERIVLLVLAIFNMNELHFVQDLRCA